MNRGQDLASWLVFACVFSLYAATAYPTLAPRDSGDLATAALTLGVAHPPGYPFYSVLGKLWIEFFSLGDPAYRLNLLSAAAGATAVTVLFSSLRAFLGLMPALGGALTWAFSRSLWKFSGLQEMYSLHALFAASLLALALAGGETAGRRARLSALLLGLGLVNHQTLVLLVPGLILLWKDNLVRQEDKKKTLWAAVPFIILGLFLYAAVWILLKDSRLAWAVVRRAEYGSLTLSGRFAAPLSLQGAWSLLVYFLSGLVSSLSWPAAALAVFGAVELYERKRLPARGLLLGFMLTGPFYFLLTRFDVSGWLARSVLESAFIIPGLLACVAVGHGIARLERRHVAAALVVGVLALAGVFRGGDSHRFDFAAHDYISDLRRRLPSGGAVVLEGDTAQFGWRYADAKEARRSGLIKPRVEMLSAQEPGKKEWIDVRLDLGPVFVAGLGEDLLAELGLSGNPRHLEPLGSVQRVREAVSLRAPWVPWTAQAGWALAALRPGGSEDSYGRDITHSYAFARYLTGRLLENSGAPEPATAEHYRLAAALDGEVFRYGVQSDDRNK